MGQLPPHTLKKGPMLNQVGHHTSRHFLRKIYMNGHLLCLTNSSYLQLQTSQVIKKPNRCTNLWTIKNEYVHFNISSHLGVSHNKVQSLLTVCCSESALFSLDFLLGHFVILFPFFLVSNIIEYTLIKKAFIFVNY